MITYIQFCFIRPFFFAIIFTATLYLVYQYRGKYWLINKDEGTIKPIQILYQENELKEVRILNEKVNFSIDQAERNFWQTVSVIAQNGGEIDLGEFDTRVFGEFVNASSRYRLRKKLFDQYNKSIDETFISTGKNQLDKRFKIVKVDVDLLEVIKK